MVNVLVRDANIDEYYYLLPRAHLHEKEKTYLGKLIKKEYHGNGHPSDGSYQLKFENKDKNITEHSLDFQDELELTSEQGISDDDNKNHSDGETKSTFIGKLKKKLPKLPKLFGRGGSRKKTRRNRKSKKLRRKSRRKTNRRRGRR